MMFRDRRDAGQKLGGELYRRGYAGAPVFAIPNGGAEVAVNAAAVLGSPVDLLVCRKLPFPDNPESGYGAIAEDGSSVLLEGPASEVTEAVRQEIAERQQEEIRRRVDVLRGGRSFPEIRGQTVILIDDGIAMGSTMRAAVRMCRRREAGRIVVAVPVAASRSRAEMEELADAAVVLEEPPIFRAVAQVYERWYDVSDEEVRELLGKAQQHRQERQGGQEGS